MGLDGHRIEVADGSYDSALLTFTLCTVTDPAGVLREIARAVPVGAPLGFLEHGLSPSTRTARWQHRLDPLERRVAGGCHLTRDTPALLRSADFAIDSLTQEHLPGPRFLAPWTFLSYGVAPAGPLRQARPT